MTLTRVAKVLAPAVVAGALVAAGTAGAEGDPAAGKELYTANCQTCHGEQGKGEGPTGQALDPSPRDFTQGNFKFDADGDGETGTDADLKMVIKNGAAAYGGSAAMMPWGHLSDQDIENLVAHIRQLQKG